MKSALRQTLSTGPKGVRLILSWLCYQKVCDCNETIRDVAGEIICISLQAGTSEHFELFRCFILWIGFSIWDINLLAFFSG